MADTDYFATMAQMRRSHAALMAEINEFVAASAIGHVAGMDNARARAHDFMDAYLDSTASGHLIARKQVPQKP